MIRLFCILLFAIGSSRAASTIDPANNDAFGANIGWIDWRADATNGAVIGQYVCSGFIYGANVGWINLGNGSPANQIRYRNDSPSDFGVNHDGRGNLRGYAYGANIGWVAFEDTGSPKIDLVTGNFTGSVWSANCGWISLSNAVAHVQTDFILPGTDSDGDGIPDAWELTYTNSLSAFGAASDADGDGVTDAEEYLADTNPLDPSDTLRILSFSVAAGSGITTNSLIWTAKATRLYQIETRTDFNPAFLWSSVGEPVAPTDSGKSGGTYLLKYTPQRYLRIRALLPLAP